MAPPTAAATPVVTSVYPNPTSTYHPYPPLPQSVAAAAAPAQVYDANTKTSYYAQPPVSVSKWIIFSLNRLWILVLWGWTFVFLYYYLGQIDIISDYLVQRKLKNISTKSGMQRNDDRI